MLLRLHRVRSSIDRCARQARNGRDRYMSGLLVIRETKFVTDEMSAGVSLPAFGPLTTSRSLCIHRLELSSSSICRYWNYSTDRFTGWTMPGRLLIRPDPARRFTYCDRHQPRRSVWLVTTSRVFRAMLSKRLGLPTRSLRIRLPATLVTSLGRIFGLIQIFRSPATLANSLQFPDNAVAGALPRYMTDQTLCQISWSRAEIPAVGTPAIHSRLQQVTSSNRLA